MHLRWHYQVVILSGGYLLGGLLSGLHTPADFLYHFLVIHLLLFGGATVYNSYWDRDEGPIGGLRNPPPLAPWTRPVSLALQFGGLLLSLPMGAVYVLFYLASMLLFWLYSHPVHRWKGHPLLSLVAIGVSTGTNSLVFGYLAAGSGWNPMVLVPAAGVALIMLSLYPVSQIYQRREDEARGDRTFVVVYGPGAVFRFFLAAYAAGAMLVSVGFYLFQPWLTGVFLVVALIAGGASVLFLRTLGGEASEYDAVMRVKYTMSLLFVLFLLAAMVIKHY
jgi:4-hydroxybenzoate polyprenyltransferase